jgi:cell wall-associated NlpC family hydrolase
MAKTGKIDTRYEAGKIHKFGKQSEIKRDKLVDYKVRSGDTLCSLARKHHTTVSKIALINNLGKKKSKLKIGEPLKIPVEITVSVKKNDKKNGALCSKAEHVGHQSEKETRKSGTKYVKNKKGSGNSMVHKVVKGDSLYSIAKKNHTTVRTLKKINHIKSANALKPGQILKIPGDIQIAAKESRRSKKHTVAKNGKGRKTKAIAAKKTSMKKIVINTDASSKKSFFERLSPHKKSPLKLSAAKKQLGKRYVWGATGPRTFDCSGFTSYVCKKSGVCVPRTSLKQSRTGKRVNRKQLKPGDLVFFDTSKRRRGYVNHVGIYLGNNKFIHASSAKHKVIITSLEKPFYKSRFKWGSRVK